MANIPNKRYFRPDEVARYLEESVFLVYKWLQRGKIKYLKHGRKIVIPREELVRIDRDGVH